MHDVSQELKPLLSKDLSFNLLAVARLSEQVRERLREEMTRRKLSQRELAGLLKWTQSHVAHVLTGRVQMTVDDMAELAFGMGLSMTEVVRDRGLEFCAEMTPSELRMLERIRQLPRPVLDALMIILDVQATTRRQERRALSKTTQKDPRR